jgi:hypothetical protein
MGINKKHGINKIHQIRLTMRVPRFASLFTKQGVGSREQGVGIEKH